MKKNSDEIKAVLFDVDGVLLDSFEANLKFFQDLMKKAGYVAPTREEYSKHMHLSMRAVIKYYSKSDSEEEIQSIYNMGKLREVKYPLELLKTPKGVKKTISKLGKKYVLGVVSSRTKTSVFEAPQMADLKDFFKVVITFEDTSLHKPNPEPLLLAANKLGISPNQIVYVGDTESDLKAAKAAGMKMIIYSKEKYSKADACTSDFEDIYKIVSSL